MKFNFYLSFLIQLAYCQMFFAQSSAIREIDSINNRPFNKKIENLFDSEKVFKNNLAKAQANNYQIGIAESYENLGLIYYYQGKYELSHKYNVLAIKSFQSQKKWNKVAKVYGEFGYQMKRRNLPEAIGYMQKGIKLAERLKNDSELKILYDNYGVLKEMKLEYDSAFYFYNKSLKIKEIQKDSIGIPYSLNKIGLLHLTEKRFNEAKRNFDKAYKIRLNIDDKIGIAESLNFFGTYYYEIKDLDKSIQYFKKAIGYSKKHKYTYLTQDNLQRISDAYELNNNYKAALDNFKKYVVYKDSLAGIEIRIKQAELDTKFITEEKERQILLQRAQLAEKNMYIIIVLALLLISVLLGYFIYNKQKLKNIQLQKENQLRDALLKIETQNKLQEQRLQISRDLHDNIGAQLTFIISSIDNLKYALRNQNPKVDEKLTNISSFTKETIIELRDTIWAMNKEEITVEDLETRISNFIENAKISLSGIRFNFISNLKATELTPFYSRDGMNIYRIIQESVNNAIKHAKASKIEVSIQKINNQIIVTIEDNGNGFSVLETEKGNGLNSVHKRAAELNAKINLVSNENGTTIKIYLNA
ncbi:tetratricopeptide repeat-containing sensor histidine kinase [Flavobacterium sediminis]|nr:tetratricopeptide repeat protein [Flavobacterium sediminis]